MSVELDLIEYLSRGAEQRQLALTEIQPDTSFMDAGILDSLLLLDFVSFIEQQFDIKIPGRDIVPEKFGTLRAVTTYVQQRVATREST